MHLNLRLIHKGLILVSLPLAFELLFVGVLFNLLNQAEQEIARELHARAVVSQINKIMQNIMEIFVGVGAYTMGRMPLPTLASGYDGAAASLPRQFDDLILLLGSEPEKQSAAMKLRSLFESAIVVINDARIKFEEGEVGPALKLIPKLKVMHQEVISRLKELLAEGERQEKGSQKAQEQLREYVRDYLVAGIICNVALAVILAYLFTTGTARQLRLVMDNTKRLAGGAKLNPPLKGGDEEITRLDQVFHTMAESLKKSQDKERELLANAELAEKRVRSIVENMPTGLIIVDLTGVIEMVNPALKSMLNTEDGSSFPLGENIKTLSNEFKSFSSEELVEHLQNATMEVEILKSNGDTFPASVSCNQYETPEGKRLQVHVVDLTDEREIERLKQNFLLLLSHELRSPLTSLTLLLSLVADGAYGNISDKGVGKLELANRNISRLIKLINDLLDLETAAGGKLTLRFANAHLSSIIEKAVDSVAGPASLKDVKVVVNNTAGALEIHADEDRLVQVLINLLSNAIRFSPEKSQVVVDCSLKDESLRMSVSDRGQGVPASHQKSIFEPFKQVNPESESAKGGVGMGLALCKMIVEKHGGEIGVMDNEGQGSVFWFEIPLVGSIGRPENN